MKTTYALVLCGGAIVYLVRSAIYKKVVYGVLPVSHVAGALALAMLAPIAMRTDLLMAGWPTTIVMLAVGFWEMQVLRKRRVSAGERPSR